VSSAGSTGLGAPRRTDTAAPARAGRRLAAHRPPYTAFMQFGHASWIPVVVFGGVFLMRYLASQKRRGGPQQRPGHHPPGQRSQFTGTDTRGPMGPPPSAPAPSVPTSAGPSTGVPAGWLRDPFVRHEERYWSGTEWTEHVLDGGVPGTDPPPATSTNGPD
jgi:hypothetical protein